jgi:hypothetical protein
MQARGESGWLQDGLYLLKLFGKKAGCSPRDQRQRTPPSTDPAPVTRPPEFCLPQARSNPGRMWPKETHLALALSNPIGTEQPSGDDHSCHRPCSLCGQWCRIVRVAAKCVKRHIHSQQQDNVQANDVNRKTASASCPGVRTPDKNTNGDTSRFVLAGFSYGYHISRGARQRESDID